MVRYCYDRELENSDDDRNDCDCDVHSSWKSGSKHRFQAQH